LRKNLIKKICFFSIYRRIWLKFEFYYHHYKEKKVNINRIKNIIEDIISSKKTITKKQQDICDFLENEIPYYDWVGFYFKNGTKEELKLATFTGEPTEHIIIPFGKGICGQVAITNENFIVQDVTEQNNYISCGWKVKSEIVIPILVQGENIGQIDVDSHSVNPFSDNDTELLEFVCSRVASLYQNSITD
jgi:L-methionine (R)-S-oxide reductase